MQLTAKLWRKIWGETGLEVIMARFATVLISNWTVLTEKENPSFVVKCISKSCLTRGVRGTMRRFLRKANFLRLPQMTSWFSCHWMSLRLKSQNSLTRRPVSRRDQITSFSRKLSQALTSRSHSSPFKGSRTK